jgi:radical SAM-linked protein
MSEFRLRLRFAKENIFISHLEFVRAIIRTLRRSGLPLQYTGGYHPRVKISTGPALAVGRKSISEYVDIVLTERIEPDNVLDALSKSFPEGIRIMEVKEI